MFSEFSYFPPRACLGIVMQFTMTACYSSVSKLEANLSNNRNNLEWIMTDILLPLMLASIFAWISDCHTERYFVAVICMVCPLVYVPTLFFGKLVEGYAFLAKVLFILGKISLKVYAASTGIFLSVITDQIDMDSIPDNEGILRKFFFYIYLSLYCGHYVPMLLFNWLNLSFGPIIGIACAFYIIHLLCTLLVHIDIVRLYIPPSDKEVIPMCFALLLKHNLKLFMTDGPELTEEIIITVKLLALLGTILWITLAHQIGDLVGQSILTSMGSAYHVLVFYTVMFFLSTFIACILELGLQPYLRNETALKTPFHYLSLGIVLFVGAMVVRGFYLHARELQHVSQPEVVGHCQLRFFNSLNEDVYVKLDTNIGLRIKRYGAGYFLKIPTRSVISVTITTSHLSFNSDLYVSQLYSYSYIIHGDRITEELVQNPDVDNWRLKTDKAYFFILDGKLTEVLTFYKEGKVYETYDMSEQEDIYAIPPGVYTVSIKTNNSEAKTDPKMLKPGYVYCLFIYQLQNETSGIEGKFFFNTLKMDENFYVLAVQGLMFAVGHMVMYVTILFYIQTESTVSTKGTIFTWALVSLHLEHIILHSKNAFLSHSTSITHYTTAFFLAAFIIAAMNYAIRYKCTEYSLK